MATTAQQKRMLRSGVRWALSNWQSQEDIVSSVTPTQGITTRNTNQSVVTPNPNFDQWGETWTLTVSGWQQGQPRQFNPRPTSENPVILKTWPELLQKPQEGITIPDFTDVDSLDQDWLQAYVDQMDYKTRTGWEITEKDYLGLQRARRRLVADQGTTINPYDSAISDATSRRDAEADRAAKQASNIYNTQVSDIEARARRSAAEQQQAWDKTMQAVQSPLSFSWFGRSTYAAEKQAEIQDAVNQNVNIINNQRDAEIARAQAERDNAPAEVLASYDEYINWLTVESQKYQSEMVQQMNEYNAQNTMDYQEKIDNIMQLSMQFQDSQRDLTPEEMKQVESYATLAINNDWEINESFLKNVPPYMMGAVMNKAAEIRGATPNKSEFWFINAWEGQIAVTDPTTWEVTFQQWPRQPDAPKVVEIDGVDSVFNPTTWEFEPVGVSWVWVSLPAWAIDFSSDQEIIDKYPWQARTKNNNPWGITFGASSQWLRDAWAANWIQFTQWTPRPSAEWGNYVKFNTIQDGIEAQWIALSRQWGDISKRLQKWVWTSEWPNYAAQVMGMAGIPDGTAFEDLTDRQKESLQMAVVQKESPWLYKELSGLTQENTVRDEPETKFKTKSQEDAYWFWLRVSDSWEIIDRIESEELVDVADSTRGSIWKKLWWQKLLPGILEAGWYQQYDQAKRDFINATLRRESGATISDSEFSNANKQYFVQPWDTKETIKQKKANRDNIYKAMKKQSANEDWFEWYDSNREFDTKSTDDSNAATNAGF